MRRILCAGLLFLFISISSLVARNNVEEDVFFVISLYENHQYELALQQIHSFESQYQNSGFEDVMTFLRANIAFVQSKFAESDSLYTILLQKPLEPEMLCEALINDAWIKYYFTNYPATLQLLSRAELLVENKEELFKIYLLFGQAHFRLMDYEAARKRLITALRIVPFEKEATLELLKLYRLLDNQKDGAVVVTALIQNPGFSLDYAEHLNVWLDYLLENAAYTEMDSLETLLTSGKPVSQTTLLRFIRKNFLQKDYEAALSKLNRVTEHRLTSQYLTAQILAEQGKTASADSIYLSLVNAEVLPQQDDYASDRNIPLMAWLEHLKIKNKTNPEAALSSLKEFLNTNSDSPLFSDAMYQYGMMLYQNKRYNEAVDVLIRLKQLPVSQLARQNAQIALGDIWFYAGMQDQAHFTFNRYLNLFPQGKYRAYATFCIALIDFENKAYPEAVAGINLLLTMNGIEPYREKALFILAEIDFFTGNYSAALTKYQELNLQYPKSPETLYRIAQTLYYSSDFLTAAEYIDKISSDSTNAFQIALLSGNIYFNLKQYGKAIIAYDKALQYSKTETERNEVSSYKALSLYRMGNFQAASQLYLKLSTAQESPETYLLMAAKAAYHSRDYQNALLLFQQFIGQFPSSSFYQNALANIANIWYNQGSFSKAVDTYIEVLARYKQHRAFDEEEQLILAGIFSNLQWCLKQAPDQTALDSLNAMIDEFQSEYIKFELQYLLLKIYYGSGEWDDVLSMADQLRSQFPQRENTEIKRLVAGSLVKINRFEEADSLYQNVYKIEPTATVLTEWAVMDVQQGNIQGALAKFEQSLRLETTTERFLNLLAFLNDNLPDSLETYWVRWKTGFSPVPEILQLTWLRWNYQQGHWAVCLEIVPSFSNSSNQNNLAEVQTIYAISLYHTGIYQKALIELLKSLYLYADYPDFVLEIKKTLIHTYIALKLPDEARRYYTQIEAELNDAEKTDISSKLSSKRANNE